MILATGLNVFRCILTYGLVPFVSFVLLGRFVCVKRNLTSFSYNEAPVLLKKQTRSSQSSKKTTKSLDIREGWGALHHSGSHKGRISFGIIFYCPGRRIYGVRRSPVFFGSSVRRRRARSEPSDSMLEGTRHGVPMMAL